MEHFWLVILTFITALAIIVMINKKGEISTKNIMYSQTKIHNLLKRYNPEKLEKKPDSQLMKHAKKNSVKVIIVDDKAYWVADNIFYTAELIENSPDFANAKPVDTSTMSQEEIDKMMFVLDNLKRG